MQFLIRWSRACCLGGIVLLGASSAFGAPPPSLKQAPQCPSPKLVPTEDFQDRSGDLKRLYEPTIAPEPKKLREHIVRNDRPVEHWHNAHPVGNGRLGAMTFAKFPQDEIYLFEETLWAGPPFPQNGPGTKKALDEVRALLAQDKFSEATQHAVEHLLVPRIWPRSYQMLGKLELTYFSEQLHHPHVSKFWPMAIFRCTVR